MNNYDLNYQQLLREILETGERKDDRTGVGTYSVFGRKLVMDLREGFPLLTTKKVFFKAVLGELLWFIQGGDNIRPLLQMGVSIWSEWPYARYCKSNLVSKEEQENGFTMKDFEAKILADEEFAKQWGGLGPVYGSQWVNWNGEGVNQLQQAIQDLKTNPDSRRIMVSAWNPGKLSQQLLPPCHYAFQFWTRVLPNGKRGLSLMFHMRSVDSFLGMPFDIASYATLLCMVAQVVDMEPELLTMTTGDTHIYTNHVEQVKLQLQREPYALPKIQLNPAIKDITAFTMDDVKLVEYNSHASIKADVAV